MKKQKINIYYHSDLDGIFSAIMIAKSYLDNEIDCKFKFIPINYDQKDWQQSDLNTQEINIVVDFMYHPQANIWYDHHLSGWGEVEPLPFNGRFDDSAPSCCEVILRDPKRLRFKDESYMERIVQGISICDYALYSTPEEPYDITKWYSALRMSLMEDGSEAYMDELIKLFIYNNPSFKALLKNVIPEIASWRAHKINFDINKGYTKFKSCYKYEDRIVNFIVPPYVKFDRYFPFKAENEALYTVYVRDVTWMSPPKCYVSVSKNPWTEKDPNVSIKELLEVFQFGENSPGGGHQDVGGLVTDTLEDALSVQNQIVSQLSGAVKQFEKAGGV